MQIVLASGSPRRRELLSQIVPDFVVDPADLDEDALTVLDPWQTAEELAVAKAMHVVKRHPGSLVIGSDTVVAYESPIGWSQLAKPLDSKDAERILGERSGRTHVVITGVAVVSPFATAAFVDTTRVTFRALSVDEISAYVSTGEPMDKAGAYAIQGGAAGFVERIEGLESNVIGLPVERLGPLLRDILGRNA